MDDYCSYDQQRKARFAQTAFGKYRALNILGDPNPCWETLKEFSRLSHSAERDPHKSCCRSHWALQLANGNGRVILDNLAQNLRSGDRVTHRAGAV